MLALRTAIIEHTTADGVHYDWLIEDPRLPDPHAVNARLSTFRVPKPPTQWSTSNTLVIKALPPHRRAYLTWQGRVSGDRGRVRRIADGKCLTTLWSTDRIVLIVQMQGLSCNAELRRLGNNDWQACFTPRLRSAQAHPAGPAARDASMRCSVADR